MIINSRREILRAYVGADGGNSGKATASGRKSSSGGATASSSKNNYHKIAHDLASSLNESITSLKRQDLSDAIVASGVFKIFTKLRETINNNIKGLPDADKKKVIWSALTSTDGVRLTNGNSFSFLDYASKKLQTFAAERNGPAQQLADKFAKLALKRVIEACFFVTRDGQDGRTLFNIEKVNGNTAIRLLGSTTNLPHNQVRVVYMGMQIKNLINGIKRDRVIAQISEVQTRTRYLEAKAGENKARQEQALKKAQASAKAKAGENKARQEQALKEAQAIAKDKAKRAQASAEQASSSSVPRPNEVVNRGVSGATPTEGFRGGDFTGDQEEDEVILEQMLQEAKAGAEAGVNAKTEKPNFRSVSQGLKEKKAAAKQAGPQSSRLGRMFSSAVESARNRALSGNGQVAVATPFVNIPPSPPLTRELFTGQILQIIGDVTKPEDGNGQVKNIFESINNFIKEQEESLKNEKWFKVIKIIFDQDRELLPELINDYNERSQQDEIVFEALGRGLESQARSSAKSNSEDEDELDIEIDPKDLLISFKDQLNDYATRNIIKEDVIRHSLENPSDQDIGNSIASVLSPSPREKDLSLLSVFEDSEVELGHGDKIIGFADFRKILTKEFDKERGETSLGNASEDVGVGRRPGLFRRLARGVANSFSRLRRRRTVSLAQVEEFGSEGSVSSNSSINNETGALASGAYYNTELPVEEWRKPANFESPEQESFEQNARNSSFSDRGSVASSDSQGSEYNSGPDESLNQKQTPSANLDSLRGIGSLSSSEQKRII